MKNKKVALIILDGWGHGIHPKSDALRLAKTPYIDSLYRNYPNSELVTFGEDVGLPDGQMGNSEVGHMNIGAGRVVYQDLAKINKAIRTGELRENIVFNDALEKAKANDKAFHFMGLLSDGGVHAHIDHLLAMIQYAVDAGLQKIYIHAFLDGRDTDPKSGCAYLEKLQAHIKNGPAQIATIVGRYYAMDRDNRWERIKIAYDALVNGVGNFTNKFLTEVDKNYQKNITDEFMTPIISEQNLEDSRIKNRDIVFFFNYRTDRPRQITSALTQKNFPSQEMKILDLEYYTMTKYDNSFKNINVIFEKDELTNTIGEVLSNANKSQIRIAETEKYPHVTFFFSGGQEEPFKGEFRMMIPSPKVATYDLQPEMSANKLTDAIIKRVEKEPVDFICLNYANTDMVGHTGNFNAAMKAAETVDSCLRRLLDFLKSKNYDAIVIADHGNSDYMINDNGSPNTAHTVNLVPCFYISNVTENITLRNGRLADVAPTILHIMGVEIPSTMTGKNLIV